MAIDNVNNGDSGGKVRTVINDLVGTVNDITRQPDPPINQETACETVRTGKNVPYAIDSKNACTSSFPWLPRGEANAPYPSGSNIVASYFRSNLIVEGTGSIAYGRYNTASGFYTHAEGYSNKALSYWSHAEGDNTQATNSGSHSEGGYTTASGWYSHAEGWQNVASGKAAHVEGYLNRALGGASHAEGWNVTASGEHAHAEGNTTRAVGNNAHSEGENTYAYGRSSHVEGNQTTTSINAYWAHSEGYLTVASGTYSHTEGTGTITRATGSHSEGYETLTLSSAFQSHVEGYQTQTGATGIRGIVSGSTINGVTTIIVPGDYTAVFRSGSMALTYNETTGGGMPYGDMFIEDIALDSILTQSGNSTIIYILGITAYSDGDVVLITRHDNLTDPDLTTFFGGPYSHAEGKQTIAANIAAHSEGRITYASGYAAHSEGYSTKAYGRHSHAEGDSTLAKGEGSHAEGKQTIARGNYSHAEGRNTEAFAAWQHATGQFNILNNTDDYFVIGDGTGPNSRSNAFGVNADRMYASNSIYFPDLIVTQSNFVLVFDTGSKRVYYTSSCCNNVVTSIIAGNNVTISSTGPNGTGAVTINSTGGGSGTPAPPDTGIQFNNSSTGTAVFDADNSFTFNYNRLSLQQGQAVYNTFATGWYSHAQGGSSIAEGSGSHSEGSSNARGDYSHAEGQGTYSNGTFSHSEGLETNAKGACSHAEGNATIASGSASHAEGYQTVAHADYQHATGRFNKLNNTSDYFVIGVGDSFTRADGFGVNGSRMYASNSIYFPNLTNTAQTNVVTYNSTTGQLFFTASNAIGGGGVSQITAGNNITISPINGLGNVTVNAVPDTSLGTGYLQYNNNGIFGSVPVNYNSSADSTTFYTYSSIPSLGYSAGVITGSNAGTPITYDVYTDGQTAGSKIGVTVILVDTTKSDVILNLDTSLVSPGFTSQSPLLHIKKISNDIKTVELSSVYPVDGYTNPQLTADKESVIIQFHSGQWYILASHKSTL